MANGTNYNGFVSGNQFANAMSTIAEKVLLNKDFNNANTLKGITQNDVSDWRSENTYIGTESPSNAEKYVFWINTSTNPPTLKFRNQINGQYVYQSIASGGSGGGVSAEELSSEEYEAIMEVFD